MNSVQSNMSDQSISIKTVVKLGGALCAYFIGSGYATGQELMQYYTSFGLKGILGLGVSFITMIYIVWQLYTLGKKKNFENPYDAYKYFLGERIGAIYQWFNLVMFIGIYLIMVTGAGAAVNQHFGLSKYVGIVALSILSLITVTLGLKKVVDIIGIMGPIIIVFSIMMGILGIFYNPRAIFKIEETLKTVTVMKAGPNFALSGFMYGTLNLASGFIFMITCGGQTKNVKEARTAGIVGIIAFCTAILVSVLSQFVFIKDIANVQIPMIVIVNAVLPWITPIFLIILLGAIYNTAAPTLWVACRKFGEDKSKEFNIAAIAIVIMGLLVGIVPFDVMVNTLYPLFSYVTIVLLGAMIVKGFGKGKNEIDQSE